MVNSGATFCDTHKNQMPFVTFKPLDTLTRAMVIYCAFDINHGLAAKYCKKCNKSLCLGCAFDHAIHGAVDIDVARTVVAMQIDAHVRRLEEESEQSEEQADQIRNIVTAMQIVRKVAIFNNRIGK